VLEFPALPHVALAAAAAGTRLTHVSSDAVFSGTALRDLLRFVI
jgi:dTDP-4-dehydrorhamnose reductase